MAETRVSVNPHNAEVLCDLAKYYTQMGSNEKAKAALAQIFKRPPRDVNVLAEAARIYEHIGEREEALDALARALQGGYPLHMIETDASLEQLRQDKRFQLLLQERKAS